MVGVALCMAVGMNLCAVPLTLYNTGEGLTQGQLDPNWNVTLPDGTDFGSAVSAVDPNGAWVAPTGTGTWIGVAGSASVPVGVYQYSTSFTIGLNCDPATAVISGNWWSDDPVASNGILVNGILASGFDGAYWFDANQANAAFSIASGFQTGLNTLTFLVENTGGPGGMLVENLSGNVACVPDAGSTALMVILGTFILGGSRRFLKH
jgi:hypothetical protein